MIPFPGYHNPPALVGTRPISPAQVMCFALVIALAWVLMPAVINPGQPGDHFEQFTWAHSMEWGYHKHPPLPTWLLALTMKAVGATPYAAYGVAALLLVCTGAFTHLVARALFGARIASVALLLWGLQWAFSWKAQLLNHNSAMMSCIAASAWLAIQACRRTRAWHWWVLLGVAAGLALLSKYQSAVPLAGIMLAMWRAGWLAQPRNRLGLMLAAVLALLIFLPHAVWVVHHDFVTLRYASTTVQQLGPLARVFRLLVFTALNVRMLLWALACIAALTLWPRTAVNEADADIDDSDVNDLERKAWLLGLLVWPLLVLAVLCLTEGVRLQDHWGFQAVQFISLWLAWQLRGLGPRTLPRLMVLALLAHVLGMAAYSRSVWDPHALMSRKRPDQFYPAQRLADVVTAEWKHTTACPLKFVVGPSYEGGMVSVYSGQDPEVLESGLSELSPWVDLSALHQSGAVYVYTKAPSVLPGPSPLHRLEFKPTSEDRSAYDVYWTSVAPLDCERDGSSRQRIAARSARSRG